MRCASHVIILGMNLMPVDYCFRCGNPGIDSSGRCWDCVNRDYNRREQILKDNKSIWKIRDIELIMKEKELKNGNYNWSLPNESKSPSLF